MQNITIVIGALLTPFFEWFYKIFGKDPSIIPASLFANDMGGMPLAVAACKNTQIGNFNAFTVSSMTGCDEKSENKAKVFRYNGYKIRKIEAKDNADVAKLIRYNLKKHGLDIPGTVYFDSCVDDLYSYYSNKERGGYFVITDKSDNVVGSIGFDKIDIFENTAELQKMYLDDSVKGKGLSYILINFVEEQMRKAGFKTSYLETHSNLKVAIHVYEKLGYIQIERPKEVAHGSMDHFYIKSL